METHNLQQGSKEWLEARDGKFTGSNAIKLLKYGRTDRARAKNNGDYKNHWMQRGHDLEPYAISAYEQVRDAKVLTTGFVTNAKYKDCLYSPDGWHDKTLVEVKCFSEKRHNEIHIRNIPAEILAQIHFGLLMLELDEARLVLFNPDLDPKKALKIIKVKKDIRLIKRLAKLMKG